MIWMAVAMYGQLERGNGDAEDENMNHQKQAGY